LPKVSVITAAYNHKEFVRHSVESVLHQTYKDYEHIVVDDGTTDGTAEILQSFGSRIKYIRQENRGTPAAINAGIRASAGEYFAILDSDDAWLPHKLERQMSVFEQLPRTAVVYSQAQVIDAEGRVKAGDLLGEPLSRDDPFEDLLKHDPIPVLTAVVKRECFDEVGGFDETLPSISDWGLWIQISTRWPIEFVPEPLALYRMHGRNTHLRVNENGSAAYERLRMTRSAVSALCGDPLEVKRKGARLNANFSYIVLRHSYGLLYRSQYSKAMRYLLSAFKIRPVFLKDLPRAIGMNAETFTLSKCLRVTRNLIRGPVELRTLESAVRARPRQKANVSGAK
jgi:glycosyltransferase involved in cell wall biosynthesis